MLKKTKEEKETHKVYYDEYDFNVTTKTLCPHYTQQSKRAECLAIYAGSKACTECLFFVDSGLILNDYGIHVSYVDCSFPEILPSEESNCERETELTNELLNYEPTHCTMGETESNNKPFTFTDLEIPPIKMKYVILKELCPGEDVIDTNIKFTNNMASMNNSKYYILNDIDELIKEGDLVCVRTCLQGGAYDDTYKEGILVSINLDNDSFTIDCSSTYKSKLVECSFQYFMNRRTSSHCEYIAYQIIKIKKVPGTGATVSL
jgi:hypothetical protein